LQDDQGNEKINDENAQTNDYWREVVGGWEITHHTNFNDQLTKILQ
jgi:hypothetical protein